MNTSAQWPFHTNDNIELESFTDVAIDERTESEVSESKFKTEVEEKVQHSRAWIWHLPKNEKLSNVVFFA